MTNRIPAELTCQQLVELVTDYLEDALAPAQRARFEQHLIYCDGCRAFLAQHRDSLRLARAAEGEPLPPQVEGELLRLFGTWKKG